jgi:type III secretion protein U
MSGSEEKNAPPSQRKLNKAREQGQVASSADFVSAMILLVGFIVVYSSWTGYVHVVLATLRNVFDLMANPSEDNMTKGLFQMMKLLGQVLVPLLIIVSATGFMAHIITKKGLIFSLDPVLPDISRIDPFAGFGRLFAKRNMIDLAVVLVRCIFWFSVSVAVIWFAMPEIVMSPVCELSCIGLLSYDLVKKLVVIALVMLIIFGALDFLLQQYLFIEQQKMSHSEVKQERKEQQGSPEIVSHRKREHRKMAMGAGGGRNAAKMATIIFASATDEAVAIMFDAVNDPIPTVIAKGKNKAATQIMKTASVMRIPVEVDPETTLQLIKVKVGDIVPERLFRPVAFALVRHGCV